MEVTFRVPFLIEFIIEAMTGIPMSSSFNAFGCIMAVLNSAMDGVLLIAFDSRTSRDVRELFGVPKLVSFKSDSNLNHSRISKHEKGTKIDSTPTELLK